MVSKLGVPGVKPELPVGSLERPQLLHQSLQRVKSRHLEVVRQRYVQRFYVSFQVYR